MDTEPKGGMEKMSKSGKAWMLTEAPVCKCGRQGVEGMDGWRVEADKTGTCYDCLASNHQITMPTGPKEKIAKEIFDTVYQWGRVGVVTDENCNTFKDLLAEYGKASREEALDSTSTEELERIVHKRRGFEFKQLTTPNEDD